MGQPLQAYLLTGVDWVCCSPPHVFPSTLLRTKMGPENPQATELPPRMGHIAFLGWICNEHLRGGES